MTTQHEAVVQADIRAAAGADGFYMWRNNVGACNDDTGRIIRYGLGNDSPQVQRRLKSSDLVGLSRTGRFVAVECKAQGWKFPDAWLGFTPNGVESAGLATNDHLRRTLAQWRFLSIVHSNGGLAGFAQSVEDFRRIMTGELVLP